VIWALLLSTLLTATPSPAKKRWLRHKDCVQQPTATKALRIRNPKRTFGTRASVEALHTATASFARRHPTRPVRVGDMSWRGGGRMRPHASHRRGLDVDVGYFRTQAAKVPYFFFHTNPKALDASVTWDLVAALLETGRVELIFMDWSLQRRLHREAKRRGLSRRRLREVFQYPRRRWVRRGIIRWSRGHNTHFHVRFAAD
jgi:murein endopeptidase